MARVRGDMRAVELVEAVDGWDAAAGGTHDDDHSRRAPLAPSVWSPPVRARVRIAVLLAAALVLVAAGVSSLVSHRRDDARLQALADVPGVLAPLSGPPRVLWTTDGWPVVGIHEVDGRLVTVLTTPAHTLEAVALEPQTGEVVWRTPLPSDAPQDAPTECVVPDAPRPGTGTAPGTAPDTDVGTDDSRTLVCVVVDEVATTTDGRGFDEYTYPLRTRLLTLDAVTGERLGDRPVTPSVSLSSIGSDMLIATIDGRGHAHVSRTHPRTGEARWTFTTPDPVPEDQFGLHRVWLHAEGDLILAHAGTVWALAPSGEVLLELPGAAPDPFGAFTQVVAGGRMLARSSRGTERAISELVVVATGRSTTVEGFAVEPELDDRSLPDLLLLTPPDGTGLVAHDTRTGRTLWAVPGHSSGPPMVLDERVIAVDDDRIESLHGVTGEVVWSTSAPGLSPFPVVTDGRVVLATTTEATDSALVAFDARTGRQVWSAALEERPHLFRTDAGRLFGYGRTGLVAFGNG